MPDGTWPKGVDAHPTKAPVVLPSESSLSSSFKDMVEKHPWRRQPPHGKEPALEEPAKKKKKLNNPPTPKGGISMREPLASRQVIANWSDDDEDAGEMLQR